MKYVKLYNYGIAKYCIHIPENNQITSCYVDEMTF